MTAATQCNELRDLVRWCVVALDLTEGDDGWHGFCADGYDAEPELLDPPPHPELLRAIVAEVEQAAERARRQAERDRRVRQWIRWREHPPPCSRRDLPCALPVGPLCPETGRRSFALRGGAAGSSPGS